MSEFSQILNERPQDLLVANSNVKHAALQAVKETLDPLAPNYSIFKDLHVEGLDAELVWAQARMLIDGVVDKLLEYKIPTLLKRKVSELEEDDSKDIEDFDREGGDFEQTEVGEDDFERFGDASDFHEEISSRYEGVEESVAEEDEEEDEDGHENNEDNSAEHPELDTGLFRLKDFQKQILDMEQNVQEDDDIDYFADLPEEESEDDRDAGDKLKYNDFFRRPRQNNWRRDKDKKAVLFDEQVSDEDGADEIDDNEELEQAMSSMRKDLFDDDDYGDEEVMGTDENLSTFEKQQREIMRQIRELEQENVAEKQWQVKGEVRAKNRPLDSLIETELDFERNAKPVPVITDESTQTLEDMIRNRIKNYEFDDLPRRLPDVLPHFRPSKTADLQETKSQKSLAKIYEEEHLRKENPDAFKQADDEKVNGAHKEIIDLFNSISRKLDSLSSWNYTPKTPKPSISIVANTSAISMEETQPVALASENMLAPQEVYTPAASSKRELVGPDGLPVAKSEMTREERMRERRKVKAKRARILRGKEETQKSKSQKENNKANVIETLKKANVTVIGSKGEKRYISGKLKKDQIKLTTSNLKL